MVNRAVEGQESILTNNSHKDWYLGHKDLGPTLAEEIDYNWDAHAHAQYVRPKTINRLPLLK